MKLLPLIMEPAPRTSPASHKYPAASAPIMAHMRLLKPPATSLPLQHVQGSPLSGSQQAATDLQGLANPVHDPVTAVFGLVLRPACKKL